MASRPAVAQKNFPEIFLPRKRMYVHQIDRRFTVRISIVTTRLSLSSLRHLRTFHRPLREGQVHRPCRNLLRGQHR